MIVRSIQKIAKCFGISDFFIGLTVLSIGTSFPEIFTHILSSIKILYHDEHAFTLSTIAVGTNVGSNLIQITLITGICGLTGLITTTKKFLRQDYLFMLFAIFLVWIFSLNYTISMTEGLFLSALYIGYLIYLTWREDVWEKVNDNEECRENKAIQVQSVLVIIGFAILLYSANLVLDSGVFFSETYGISGSLIGALIVGVCTALPELTTALVSLFYKSPGFSLGTLIGSNITNPMLALGIGAAISEYEIDDNILWFDLPFWFIVSVIALAFFRSGLRLHKKEAGVLIGLYIAYLSLRVWM